MRAQLGLLLTALLIALAACPNDTQAGDSDSVKPVQVNPTTLNAQISTSEREILQGLQKQYIQYFLDNQCGEEAHETVRDLVLDRQRNFGQRYKEPPVISSSTSGYACCGIALAYKHGLISREEAVSRIKRLLTAALALPHEKGIGPHFVNVKDGSNTAIDKYSTVDWGWLLVGAGWSAQHLQSEELEVLFQELYKRVQWQYWTHESESGLLRHGRHLDGRLLSSCWDRANAETLVLYLLATGAHNDALPATVWQKLEPQWVEVRGIKIASGDLGLFTHQWGLELFPAEPLTKVIGIDLMAEHAKAVQAELDLKRESGLWGISAGDEPCDEGTDQTGGISTVIRYAEHSLGANDQTFNITASIASIGVNPRAVLQNLEKVKESEQRYSRRIMGRYGPSNFKICKKGDKEILLIGSDAVGVDVGAAMLAIENVIGDNDVRNTFRKLPCIQRATERMAAVAKAGDNK